MRNLFIIILSLVSFCANAQYDYLSAKKILVSQSFRPGPDTTVNPLWVGEIRQSVEGGVGKIWICISLTGQKWQQISGSGGGGGDVASVFGRTGAVTALQADYAAFYEPIISTGTTLQYIRGDKSLATLNTSIVPESGNLYFTSARARGAISLTTTGTSGAATYNSTTGVLNIPAYEAGTVTNIATNTATGITGGPIETIGTLAIDTNLLKTHASHKKAIDSLGALIGGGGLIAGRSIEINATAIDNAGVGGLYDSTVYVYPGDVPSAKLDLIPAHGGRLVFMPGAHTHGPDTLNSILYIDRDNITVELKAGAVLKVADNSNTRINTVEVSRNYFAITGLDDISAQANTTPPLNDEKIVVTISSVGTPNQFTISGASSGNGVYNITGAFQTIGTTGVDVMFAATTGHTLNDKWYLLTSSTPAAAIRVGAGFQTDTIKNVKIVGQGKIDGNYQNQFAVNYLGEESNFTIGAFGRVEDFEVRDVEIVNSERSIWVTGRHSGTFLSDGTTSGGTEYNASNIRVSGVYSHSNYAGFLFGHPAYRGYTRNVVVDNCHIEADEVAVEPNHRLDSFAIVNNIIQGPTTGLKYALHMWRGPQNGVIKNNIITGNIADNAPSGWYRSASVDVDGQTTQEITRIVSNKTYSSGKGLEFLYNESDSTGAINSFSRTHSTYGNFKISAAVTNMGDIMYINRTSGVGIGESSIDATALHIKKNAWPVSVTERTTGSTATGVQAVSVIRVTTTGSSSDGYGPLLTFQLEDNTSSTAQSIAQIGGIRSGADNSGALGLYTYNSGSIGERWRISNLGYLSNTGATGTSTLQVNGSIATGFRARTTAWTATIDDHTITGDATSAAFQITLPTAVGITGRIYVIKKIDASANAVTVGTTSSQTIDGSTTFPLGTQYKYVQVQSDGANWIVISNN